jgi:hypothetical protein
MSRDEGFRNADHDVGFLRDLKVRRLRKTAPDEGEGAIRTLVYIALRDACWDTGERLTVDEVEPPYAATSERLTALQSVGLLDSTGRIPKRAWESWFRPAWERREKMRAAGAEGNRRRWGERSAPDSGPDSAPDSGPESQSYTPSGPANQQAGPDRSSVSPTGTAEASPLDEAKDDLERAAAPLPDPSRNGRETCPGCGDLVTEGQANVTRNGMDGQLWHVTCPPPTVSAHAGHAAAVARAPTSSTDDGEPW